jgi:hypothetical protein
LRGWRGRGVGRRDRKHLCGVLWCGRRGPMISMSRLTCSEKWRHIVALASLAGIGVIACVAIVGGCESTGKGTCPLELGDQAPGCEEGEVCDYSFRSCTCTGGVCVETCAPNETQCGSVCYDLQQDVNGCGSCQKQCAIGDACVKGTCTRNCGEPDPDAGSSDARLCSSRECPAGDLCVAASGSTSCVGSYCQSGSCTPNGRAAPDLPASCDAK